MQIICIIILERIFYFVKDYIQNIKIFQKEKEATHMNCF